MKTNFKCDNPPAYDEKIAMWVSTYTTDHYDGAPRYIGILANINGKSVVYRIIEPSGIWESEDAYKFLESIGLVDFQIYDHPQLNAVYGLPEDRPKSST